MERLWTAPVPLLLTVAEKGGGYIQQVKEKADVILISVTAANRDELPERILQLLGTVEGKP
jgi:nucleoside-triphosphatase THEP1